MEPLRRLPGPDLPYRNRLRALRHLLLEPADVVDRRRTRVRRYDIFVSAGEEVAEQHSSDPKQGPYVAETYTVGVDQDYVVVEVQP